MWLVGLYDGAQFRQREGEETDVRTDVEDPVTRSNRHRVQDGPKARFAFGPVRVEVLEAVERNRVVGVAEQIRIAVLVRSAQLSHAREHARSEPLRLTRLRTERAVPGGADPMQAPEHPL